MRQVLFRIPGIDVPVFGFGLLVVVGFMVGLVLAARRSRLERLDPRVVDGMAIAMLIAGVIGARLFYVAEYWGEKVETFADVFKVWGGGIAFYGGVVGALIAFFGYRAFHKFPVLATLDAIAPSVAIGMAIGRVGCFLNGCCYGGLCPIPWVAVRFPPGTPAWAAQRVHGLLFRDATSSLPVHPTQLYSAIDGLLIFALLTAYYPLRRRDGEVTALLMLSYSVTRFLLERLRDDESPFVWGMTLGQAVSLGLFCAGLTLWRGLESRPAPLWADRDTGPA